tara:strand:- start:528 stop:941 length:414 start_codon:yes stop_codon:yes gene_type:complete
MAFKMNGWSAFTKKANKPSDGRAASSAFQSNGDDDKETEKIKVEETEGNLSPDGTMTRTTELADLVREAKNNQKVNEPNLLNKRQRERLKTLIDKRKKVDKNTPAWATIQNKINKLKEKEKGLEKGTYKRRKRKDYR